MIESEYQCPLCGNPVIGVTVYDPYKEDPQRPEEGSYPMYGLLFLSENGTGCCSFNEGQFRTMEEAQAAVKSRTLRQWISEGDHCYLDDQEDLIGDQSDGDPYDREPLEW